MSNHYSGPVEYTVDTTSIASIGFYYRLQSLNPELHSLEAQACEKVADLCNTKGFQEHISIRIAWQSQLIATAENEIDRWVYEEAFELLRFAR